MNLLKILLLAAFLNSLVWIIIVPLWQYPDEQSHFAQVQYIAENGQDTHDNKAKDTSYEIALSEKLLQTKRDENGNNKFTYHPEYKIEYTNSTFGKYEGQIANLPKSTRSQFVKREATLNPPLYYYLGSFVYKLFSSGSLFSRVYAIRIMSALIFIGTIIVAFKIGELIFRGRILPFTLAAAVAFMPMLVFSSTGILPDTLTNFLFSLFILICLKIMIEGFSYALLLASLITIALGTATRQNSLMTVFILPTVFLHQLIVNKKSRFKIILSIFFGLALLSIASSIDPEKLPATLSSMRKFQFPDAHRGDVKNPFQITIYQHIAWTLEHTYKEVWPWYWGIYKWLSLSLPHVIYQVINRLAILSAIGLILGGINTIRKNQIKKAMPLLFLIFVAFIYFVMITAFDYAFRRNNGYSFGIQGRYFFPAIVPQMAILLTGFLMLFKVVLRKYARIGIFIILILFFLFNSISQFVVASSYYNTSSFQTFVTQASQYKPLIFKGNIIIAILGLSLFTQVIFLFTYGKYIIKEK